MPCRGPEPRPRQGEVLRAIKAVLAGHPEGLRTIEIHPLVEAGLDRSLGYSTLKTDLASNAGRGKSFERVRRGVYRLNASDDLSSARRRRSPRSSTSGSSQ